MLPLPKEKNAEKLQSSCRHKHTFLSLSCLFSPLAFSLRTADRQVDTNSKAKRQTIDHKSNKKYARLPRHHAHTHAQKQTTKLKEPEKSKLSWTILGLIWTVCSWILIGAVFFFNKATWDNFSCELALYK
ncbi:hypothetical protein AMECASPLE_025615 [Ameca splendens]|uniref:Uncharacterized protein n=1 Tax=Ameca splendens TaxID=208324 RepID=A0ABV0Z4P0_9TELE